MASEVVALEAFAVGFALLVFECCRGKGATRTDDSARVLGKTLNVVERTKNIRTWAQGALLLIAIGSCAGAARTDAPETSVARTGSLYERLGGIDVLRRLVDDWIVEVASDERIRELFVGVDMARLKLRLVERLCVLAGGPCLYRGASLREHHRGLGVTPEQVRAFLEDLEPAVAGLNIERQHAEQLRTSLAHLAASIFAPGR